MSQNEFPVLIKAPVGDAGPPSPESKYSQLVDTTPVQLERVRAKDLFFHIDRPNENGESYLAFDVWGKFLVPPPPDMFFSLTYFWKNLGSAGTAGGDVELDYSWTAGSSEVEAKSIGFELGVKVGKLIEVSAKISSKFTHSFSTSNAETRSAKIVVSREGRPGYFRSDLWQLVQVFSIVDESCELITHSFEFHPPKWQKRQATIPQPQLSAGSFDVVRVDSNFDA